MDEEQPINSPPLPPHKYPWWVIGLTLIVLSSLIASVRILPNYLTAARKLQQGKKAYLQKNYQLAIALQQESLAIIPSAKETKIALAEAVFADEDPLNDSLGLLTLKGVQLKKKEWQRIEKVLPQPYHSYFQKKVE